MKETVIKEKYEAILANAISKNLKTAFDILAAMLCETRRPEWVDKKNELEQNYKYLLQYAIDGIDDPEQENIYNNIRNALLNLSDHVYNALMTNFSNMYPYVQKRAISRLNLPNNEEIEHIFAQNEDNEEKENLLSLVFSRFWLKAFYSEREIMLIESLIFGDETHSADKCMMISALMLSLLLQYDEKKMEALTTISASSTGEVQNRAFIALLLCCSTHHNRIKLNASLNSKIQLISQKAWFNEKFVTSILLFINGLDTEKVNKELKDDIMPSLIKDSGFISDNLDLNSLINGSNSFTENPDWEKLTDKGDIADKVQRFVELQQNGADVFMGTFSAMKSHPFFSKIHNWFRPYNTTNAWVKKEFKGKDYKVFTFISANPAICDSDRYSMLFSLSSVPENYLTELENTLNNQLEQLRNLKPENPYSDDNISERIDIQQYWQNLYRFFKLHPYKGDFTDPYNNGIDIVNLPFINYINNKNLITIADAMMKKRFYAASIPILLFVSNKKQSDANTLQKLGYCYQKKNMFNEALNFYNKAELVSASSAWLKKTKAFCYMQIHNYTSAYEIYSTLSESSPNDLHLVLNMANCLIAQKRYNDAIPALFKLEYLDPCDKITRLIAWILFIIKDYDRSSDYMNRIPTEKRTSRDWTILGHVSWCQKHKGDAVSYYTQACKKAEGKDSVINDIRNDIEILVNNGVNKSEIPLVLDRIRYTE